MIAFILSTIDDMQNPTEPVWVASYVTAGGDHGFSWHYDREDLLEEHRDDVAMVETGAFVAARLLRVNVPANLKPAEITTWIDADPDSWSAVDPRAGA